MVAILLLLSALQLTASSAFSVGAGFAITSSSANGRASSSRLQMSEFMTHYEDIQVDTDHAMSVFDITPQIEAIVKKSGCKEGTVTVLSKHSTVSVSINEMEGRLSDDIRQFFLNLAPPHLPYLHNDLDYRVGPEDWPGGDEAWREFRRTQPVNTHSHLIAMMLGTSECIPISGGEMKKGKYQSILMVDIDGPKSRGIAVQITGGK
ncbi:hypothetical protein FRACYDRAFT_271179 [Fragilariopsis cylindrus CCMP1102]|uniref:Secondary thiamine-phosphate synthase enzyme n=1 Tax=Fragilariopsis cylindrus CCMP1102 TaxID=635003 RepID=A0A1E7EW05_9STRA|nr:hypothetical protein FRACYDRAFT_271179 [Fragilariopsis cylindrus CCMP1102]|eukprot:OEU10046.1 hypothetical protein FRACYDRAFT_271179 [Fragilariopsis cylindrus CCMP1102]